VRLVGSAAFKAVGMSDPHPAGSIPVHLRQVSLRSLRRLVLCAVAFFVLSPAGAAWADPAQPGNTESLVDAVKPATDAVKLDIVGSDAFVRMKVERGHEVFVTGYDEEPYLWVSTAGTVFINEWSPTGILNETRYGGSQDPLPEYEEGQEPVWKPIGQDGMVLWHDHRVHWMSPLQPAAIDDNGLVQQWFIPMTIDATPSTVSGSLYVRDAPQPWWWLIAVPAGVVAFAFTMGRRRAFAVVLCAILAAVGLVASFTLPGVAREFPAMPLIALFGAAAGVAALVLRRAEIQQALGATSAVAALTAVVLSRDSMSKAFVPGLDNPWMMRVVVPLVFGAAVVSLWRELTALLRTN